MYKLCCLKELLTENKWNRRNNHMISTEYQNIYNFWLSNSINSNKSICNVCKITKLSFLEQYPNITYPNLKEKTKVLKNGSKKIFKVGRKIYTESVRKLHAKYNESCKSVLLTVFFKTKLFYCHPPSERSKVVYALPVLIHISCLGRLMCIGNFTN